MGKLDDYQNYVQQLAAKLDQGLVEVEADKKRLLVTAKGIGWGLQEASVQLDTLRAKVEKLQRWSWIGG